MIGPALVLSVIVGLFHVSAYVFIRGSAGARVPLLFVASILGAWAGDAVGGRLGIDPIRIGDFHLLSASIVAWLGIGLVAVVAVLVPEGSGPRQPAIVSSIVRRPAPAAALSADSAAADADLGLPPAIEPEPDPEPEAHR